MEIENFSPDCYIFFIYSIDNLSKKYGWYAISCAYLQNITFIAQINGKI